MSEAEFPLGQVVITPGALAAYQATGEEPIGFVLRHMQGDWGEVDAEDAQANEAALTNGLRLLSAYRLTDETRIWIITEAV
jgi:hypothetical protein